MRRLSTTPALLGTMALWLSSCGGSTKELEPALPVVSSTASEPLGDAVEELPEAQGHVSQALIPRTVFFGNPDKAGPQLSPDGKQLAYLAERDGVLNVWVAPLDALDQARAVTADKTRPVGGFFWAFDNAHILYSQDAGGDENWHVFSSDLASGTTLDLTPIDKIAAQVAGVSEKFPTRVVVGINDRSPQLHDLYVIDILTGDRSLLQENPGFIDMSVDDDFKVRFGTAMSPEGGIEIKLPPASKRQSSRSSRRKLPSKSDAPEASADAKLAPPAQTVADWTAFMSIGQEDAMTTSILGFDKSGKKLYLWDSRGRDTSALMVMDIKSKKETLLAENALADGESVHFDPKSKKPLAASFNYARRQWTLLDRSLQQDFTALQRLSDGEANVVSSSHDGKLWVIAFVDDDGPVKYYLWNRKTQKETFLFSNRKALEQLPLAKMHAPVIDSRDGMKLVNYLSLPPASDPDGNGKPASALPMVLLVHGGPWGRDSWGYNPLHQLLTNRGYAVLSVNFRGSTGFGKRFINAANMEWAGKMHEDLLDSVDWAIEEGIAKADKVCIMGGSYGGYATLVGLTFTPEVFACGVDIVGPSNIITLLEAIPPYWKPMQDMFKTRVGDWTSADGREMLLARSPLSKVDKIVRPLLIGQGANDPRVKQSEADQIVAAMQEGKIPVSYVLFPDEGHGFHRPPNNLAFFAATEAFLSAHLGGEYQEVSPEEVAGSTVTVPVGLKGIPGFSALVDAMKKH